MHLTQDRDLLQDIVNTVMNLRALLLEVSHMFLHKFNFIVCKRHVYKWGTSMHDFLSYISLL
jgi:hypothetical protein